MKLDLAIASLLYIQGRVQTLKEEPKILKEISEAYVWYIDGITNGEIRKGCKVDVMNEMGKIWKGYMLHTCDA